MDGAYCARDAREARRTIWTPDNVPLAHAQCPGDPAHLAAERCSRVRVAAAPGRGDSERTRVERWLLKSREGVRALVRRHVSRHEYRGTVWDKRFYVICNLVCGLVLSADIFAPGKGGNLARVIAGIFGSGAILCAWRGVRVGRIRADGYGVTACGYLRHWHWHWSEVDHFETVCRAQAFNPSMRDVFAVRLANGRAVRISAINARHREDANWLVRAVRDLNVTLQECQRPDA